MGENVYLCGLNNSFMPTILFIWYKRSRGILEGGGQASKRNFELLRSIVGSNHIDSYYVHDEYRRKTLWSYICGAFFFLFRYYYGLTPRRVQEIVRQAQSYDYVFIDRSLFGIVAKRLKQSGYRGQILVYFHNVEAIYFDAKLPRIPGRNLIIRTADQNDRYSCQYADKVIALNERDAQVLEQRYGRRADLLIPITLSDRMTYTPTAEPTRTRPQCLFFGAYFTPNNQGILWFVEHVLPHANIDLRIVGKGMAKLKAESPLLQDIEVISDAPDLQAYIEQADIVVLPIFSGSGMKVKTCESLMYGKNIVGSCEAFEGYTADYERIGGLCNTAEEFIARLNDIAAHPRPRFNAYARQVYLERYSYDAVQKTFQTLLSHDA